MGDRLKRLVALHLFPAEDTANASLHRRNEGGTAHHQHPFDLSAGNAPCLCHVDGVIQNIIEGHKKIVLLQKIQKVILGVAKFVSFEMPGIEKTAAAFALGGKLLLDLTGKGGKLRQDLLAFLRCSAGTLQKILQEPPIDVISAEEGARLSQHPALRRTVRRRSGKGFRHADDRNIKGSAAEIYHTDHRTGAGGAVGDGCCH